MGQQRAGRRGRAGGGPPVAGAEGGGGADPESGLRPPGGVPQEGGGAREEERGGGARGQVRRGPEGRAPRPGGAQAAVGGLRGGPAELPGERGGGPALPAREPGRARRGLQRHALPADPGPLLEVRPALGPALRVLRDAAAGGPHHEGGARGRRAGGRDRQQPPVVPLGREAAAVRVPHVEPDPHLPARPHAPRDQEVLPGNGRAAPAGRGGRLHGRERVVLGGAGEAGAGDPPRRVDPHDAALLQAGGAEHQPEAALAGRAGARSDRAGHGVLRVALRERGGERDPGRLPGELQHEVRRRQPALLHLRRDDPDHPARLPPGHAGPRQGGPDVPQGPREEPERRQARPVSPQRRGPLQRARELPRPALHDPPARRRVLLHVRRPVLPALLAAPHHLRGVHAVAGPPRAVQHLRGARAPGGARGLLPDDQPRRAADQVRAAVDGQRLHNRVRAPGHPRALG